LGVKFQTSTSVIDNFRQGLYSHVGGRADAKTSLVVFVTEFKHPNYSKAMGTFLGMVIKSMLSSPKVVHWKPARECGKLRKYILKVIDSAVCLFFY
jgi:hypothetical protein